MIALLLVIACGAAADDSTDAGAPGCLGAAALSALDQHVRALAAVAAAAPEAASTQHVTAFFQLPGVDASSGLGFDLPAPCDGAHTLDPSCFEGVCYSIECTGAGADWTVHAEDEGRGVEPTDFNGWQVTRGRVGIAWHEGTAALDTSWDVLTLTAPDGVDWRFTGTGRLAGVLDLEEVFPAVLPDTSMEVSIIDGASGEIRAGERTLATWNGASFVSTCEE